MNAPKLTIVTPVKNGVQYLQPCLDSVAAARAGGLTIEHIVVDAASTDGTLDMLARTPDTTVLVEPTMDSIAAMEHGRDRAVGDYILLLMADDVLATDFAVTMNTLFSDHPRCELALFACEFFEEHAPSHIAAAPRRIWTVLNKYPGMNSAIVRRDVFLRIEMPKMFYYVNDRAMMLRLWSAANAVTISDQVLVRMRMHEESATSSIASTGEFGRDCMKFALDLQRGARNGPAADIFAAYAWRRAVRAGGALPPLASLARVPMGLLRLAGHEDQLKQNESAGAGAIVTMQKPFAFAAGTRAIPAPGERV